MMISAGHMRRLRLGGDGVGSVGLRHFGGCAQLRDQTFRRQAWRARCRSMQAPVPASLPAPKQPPAPRVRRMEERPARRRDRWGRCWSARTFARSRSKSPVEIDHWVTEILAKSLPGRRLTEILGNVGCGFRIVAPFRLVHSIPREQKAPPMLGATRSNHD